MDLFDVQFPHELNRLCVDHLSWHHDGKSRRVRNYKVCRNEVRSIFQALVDFGTEEFYVLALLLTIGVEERGAHVTLRRSTGRVWTERLEKGAEIRKVRYIRHERLYARGKCLLRFLAAVSQTLLDSLGNFPEHFN